MQRTSMPSARLSGANRNLLLVLVAVSAFGLLAGSTVVERRAAALDDHRLAQSLESLRAATELSRSGARLGVGLSAVWFPTPGRQGQAVADPLVALAADRTTFEADLRRLRELAPPAIGRLVDDVEGGPRVLPFRLAVSDALAGRPAVTRVSGGADGDVDLEVRAAFGGYLAQGELLDQLVQTIAENVEAEATAPAATEAAEQVVWAAAFFTICAAVILLGRRVARSVDAGATEERAAPESDLAFQATHDALTGIRNRAAALAELRAAIDRSQRDASPLAVLFLDLNEFKSINDRFGHAAGDIVLRATADRVGHCLRAVDFVARLGGDEFLIVAEGVPGIDGAVALAHRVADAIGEPIVLGDDVLRVGVAVGIALRSPDTLDPLVLLGQADGAMYRAKRGERSSIEVFDEQLRAEAVARATIERELADALLDDGGGGLCLHYQPVLAGATGALAGVEALIRWNRGGAGLVPPDCFIPTAEATDLIIDLDRWVLDQAARQLVAWSSVPGLADVPIAVNVSGRHLLSGLLPESLHDVLARYAFDPSRLSIEITETVLLTDLVAAGEQLDAVHLLGVRVAIDDFGIGYTSPAHLQYLPLDTIKIDRSFVNRIHEGRGRSLVRLIIELGHAIDVAIVAEGVETSEELEALADLGADYLQGFLLSRPIPADELPAFAAKVRGLEPIGLGALGEGYALHAG